MGKQTTRIVSFSRFLFFQFVISVGCVIAPLSKNTTTMNTPDTIPAAVMTANELRFKLKINEKEMQRRIDAGVLPRPFILNGKRCFFRSEIDAARGQKTIRKAIMQHYFQ